MYEWREMEGGTSLKKGSSDTNGHNLEDRGREQHVGDPLEDEFAELDVVVNVFIRVLSLE